jgi:hypothetical protein
MQSIHCKGTQETQVAFCSFSIFFVEGRGEGSAHNTRAKARVQGEEEIQGFLILESVVKNLGLWWGKGNIGGGL